MVTLWDSTAQTQTHGQMANFLPTGNSCISSRVLTLLTLLLSSSLVVSIL